MRQFILWPILAFGLTAAFPADAYDKTFTWDNVAQCSVSNIPGCWPAGTTVELSVNGIDAPGLDGTTMPSAQHALTFQIAPGARMDAKIRAVTPAGTQCGSPPVPCPYSEWTTLTATLPVDQTGLWVKVATATGALPAGWSTQDIGSVGLAGSASTANGTYTLTGAGADIWGTADAFRFAGRTLAGDGSIVARVASMTNTDPWAKAGVMIRESLNANSTTATMAVTPSNGIAFQSRLTTGGSSSHTVGAAVKAPYWVKLARVGNHFTAYQSADGATWAPVGSAVTITMATGVWVGLAVTSHNASALNTAVLDHVSVTGSP
jgi:regulation of enolase protein 1 (concanavalin A-like superfamily)